MWIEAEHNALANYTWNWQVVSLNCQWEVTNVGMPNGAARKTPNNKSETASDATNMFAIVRIRRFNIITRSVRKFPTNRNNTIRAYKPDSTITLALLLDLNSLNISASWSSVESIFFKRRAVPASKKKYTPQRVKRVHWKSRGILPGEGLQRMS